MTLDGSLALTRPVIYDNNCSCALNKSCTTQAVFINESFTSITPVKGFKIGCTPTESFLSSTLECFYDLSCIERIQQYIHYAQIDNDTKVPILLFANSSRFLVNTTIFDLVNHLFVETWSATVNYSAYFHQCSPILCSYTYLQQLNSFYTITLLLGLYGGLNFVLKWLCPNIVYFLAKLYHWRKRRSNIVRPADSRATATTIQTVSTTFISTKLPNDTTTTNSEPVFINPAPKYVSCLFIADAI